MQNQCTLNVRSKCILNALRIRKGTANYDQARKLLEDRYGKTQVIISAHMDNLLKLNPCTSDKPQQLRYLYDQMQVQIRGLESLGVTAHVIVTKAERKVSGTKTRGYKSHI